MIGGDVPDDLCYQWAKEYFMDLSAEEDKTEEDKEFVPKPYNGKAAPKSKKKETKKKSPTKKEAAKPSDDQQINFFSLGDVINEQASAS